jgi:hypothetical protein
MFENIKALKIAVLVLFAYSIAITTTFITQKSYSSSSYLEQINQLNAQVINLKVELESKEKDNKDLIAIREMMEKDRAEKEAAQRSHEEASSGFGNFWGDTKFDRSVFDALEGKTKNKNGAIKR